MNNRSNGWWLAGGLLLALVLRAGYAAYAYRHPNPSKTAQDAYDPDSYDRMGLHILDTGIFSTRGGPSTEREPLYPLILAGAHAVFGRSPSAGIVLNVIFGVLTCWLVYLITLSLWGDAWTARLALGLACVFPEWIYYGAYLFRESLLTLLMAAWTWLWFERERIGLPRAFIGMGLLFGAAGLVRSAVLPIGAVFILLAAWRIAPRRWPATIGLFLACAVAAQTPWVARNYRLTGRFIAGASMGGCMMYSSLFKDYDRPEVPLEAPLLTDPVFKFIHDNNLSSAEGESLCYRASLRVMTDTPGVFWHAFVRKALKLWRLSPSEGWNYGYSFGWLELVSLTSNGGLLALGLIGLIEALKRPAPIDFLLVPPPIMTIVYGFYWAVMRLHTPLMLSFMPLAALALREAAAGLRLQPPNLGQGH